MHTRATLVLLLTILLAGPAVATDQPRPNVVFILADDLGYADVGFQGCRDIPTPNIDRIAAEGVRFTDGYVTGAVCSPTRAGLATGRYQQRFGHEFNTGGVRKDASKVGLPTSETTLADMMRKAGYVTGAVGKWHLGLADPFHPTERGYADWFGFLGGARSYWNDPRGRASPLQRGQKTVESHGYLTDEFGREAVAFIERNRKKPFFLYLAFNAVHSPMHAKEADLERFAGIEDPKRRKYAGMVHAMDVAVGRVLATLSKHGLDRNTIVVFLSDNGGPPRVNASRNDPLRGGKGQMYEGGIRVPFAIRWPARLPAKTVYSWPVVSLDLVATAAAAAGATVPRDRPIDGVDLLPHLLGGQKSAPHETLHWRSGDRWAVRHGDLKLVKMGDAPELFDLAADPSETADLAGKRPLDAKRLASIHAAWSEVMTAPLWPKPVRDRNAQRRQRVAEWFRTLDRDRDGRISRAEGESIRRFDALDRDDDGYLTREEAQAGTRRRR